MAKTKQPVLKTPRRMNAEDTATVLAALRLFQRTYEDMDAKAIRADWPEHFRANNGRAIRPLSTPDIDDLCEAINCGDFDAPPTTPAMPDDSDTFGHVSWCAEDIKTALKERGKPLTDDNIDAVSASYYCRHIEDSMIERGWENIYMAVEELGS